ncbi:MAG: DUF2207 domain-containing protein [Clostridia bacterium]|nr:DUF2207 domain-containing protein [Clostridia bacterium]
MKKVFKIFFLFVFCFIAITISKTAQANSISKISMDIYIDNNGNATVTEVWNCSVNQGSEVYHPYYNLGTSKISNLTVSEGSKAYTTLSSWKTSGNLSSKAYKCGINEISNGVELCWGISEYGSHTYTVKYNISNFVSSLADSQMIYWTLIPYDFSSSIGNAYIKIYTDFKISSTTDVWGYGNYGGTAYVYDGYIEMQSDGRLSTDEYMTILVKFPKGTFNTANTIDQEFSYYYNMAQEGATAYKENSNTFVNIIFDILEFLLRLLPFIIFSIIGIVAGNANKFDYGPEGRKFSKETPYFRDIPCQGNLLRAYYIAFQYGIINNKTDLFGAIILKWLKESFIRIEQKEAGTIFKKENAVIILNETNPAMIADMHERKLFNMLYEASADGILENKEFEKWCKKSYSKVLSWFDDIITEQKNALIREGLIQIEEKRKVFKSKTYHMTPNLRKEAEEIYGLKRYLLDYTLIPDREAIEVRLFEEYLIFAQMLGIAKQVAKEFKDLYPEIIEQSHYTSYDYIMFVHMSSNHGMSTANSAKARAESYSSGGGGFSSGGGGGGSFGGGGGGGGFR